MESAKSKLKLYCFIARSYGELFSYSWRGIYGGGWSFGGEHFLGSVNRNFLKEKWGGVKKKEKEEKSNSSRICIVQGYEMDKTLQHLYPHFTFLSKNFQNLLAAMLGKQENRIL